jgi:hypothetical protein
VRHAVVSLVRLVQVGVLASCAYPPLPNVVVPREVEQFSVTPSRDLVLLFLLFLLFLIDDSPSMADKQANLATSFPSFIEVLGLLPVGARIRPGFHRRLVVEGQAMLPGDAYVSASCALVPAG